MLEQKVAKFLHVTCQPLPTKLSVAVRLEKLMLIHNQAWAIRNAILTCTGCASIAKFAFEAAVSELQPMVWYEWSVKTSACSHLV